MASSEAVIGHVFYGNPDQYPPIVNSVRLLAEAGYQSDLWCRYTGEDWGVSYPQQVAIRRLDLRGGSSWREYLRFVWHVYHHADPRASLVVGHDMHGYLAAWLLSRRWRRALVYQCHDFTETCEGMRWGGRFVKAFERRFARSADFVIVPDAQRGDEIAKALRLRQSPMTVANAPLRVRLTRGEALHRALAVQGKQYRRIVFRQGRIGQGHAIEATLCSIPLWSSRDWGFVVMGIGQLEYLDALLQLAYRLGVADRFFILPPVSYDRVFEFTPGAHVGHALYEPVHINNRYITTASNKIMEYMAAGLPLLVSDRAGLRSLVQKYQCGVTADEGSPQSIADAVNTLLGDADLACRMGAASAKAFQEEFNYKRQFAPVLEAFRSLTRKSGAHTT